MCLADKDVCGGEDDGSVAQGREGGHFDGCSAKNITDLDALGREEDDGSTSPKAMREDIFASCSAKNTTYS